MKTSARLICLFVFLPFSLVYASGRTCERLSALTIKKVQNAELAMSLARPGSGFIVDLTLKVRSQQAPLKPKIHAEEDIEAVDVYQYSEFTRAWAEAADQLVTWGIVSKHRRASWKLAEFSPVLPEEFRFNDLVVSAEKLNFLSRKSTVNQIWIRGIQPKKLLGATLKSDAEGIGYESLAFLLKVKIASEFRFDPNADAQIKRSLDWMALAKQHGKASVLIHLPSGLKEIAAKQLKKLGFQVGHSQILKPYGLTSDDIQLTLANESEDVLPEYYASRGQSPWSDRKYQNSIKSEMLWVSGAEAQVFSLFFLRKLAGVELGIQSSSLDYTLRFLDTLISSGISLNKKSLYGAHAEALELSRIGLQETAVMTIAGDGKAVMDAEKIQAVAHSNSLLSIRVEKGPARSTEALAASENYSDGVQSFSVIGVYAEILKLIDKLNPDFDSTNEEFMKKARSGEFTRYALIPEQRMKFAESQLGLEVFEEDTPLAEIPKNLNPDAFYPSAKFILNDPTFTRKLGQVSERKQNEILEIARKVTFPARLKQFLEKVAKSIAANNAEMGLLIAANGEFYPEAVEAVQEALFSNSDKLPVLLLQLAHELMIWAKRASPYQLEKMNLKLLDGELVVFADRSFSKREK